MIEFQGEGFYIDIFHVHWGSQKILYNNYMYNLWWVKMPGMI